MPTVVQLKQQLSNLGLSTSGLKADLVSRLADASASTSVGDSSSPSLRKKRRTKGGAKKSSSSSSSVPSKDGLTANEKKDMKDLSTLTRSQIEARFEISGKAGKEGTTFIATGKSGQEYAIKLFKATKSSAMLSKEAMYQKMAAERGISPRVMGVNTKHKFIIMERLQETIVDLMRRRYPGEKQEYPLEEAQQNRIIEICEQLDAAGVLHNDGNPL